MKNLLILALLFSINALAKTDKKMGDPSSKVNPINLKMSEIAGYLKDLAPYLSSEKEFTKEENAKNIRNGMSNLSAAFRDIHQQPEVQMMGLSINRDLMVSQIDEAKTIFENGNRIHSRFKIISATQICISCHLQLPDKQRKKFFNQSDVEKMKLEDFDRAEVLYIIRDFDKSMMWFDRYLAKVKKDDDDEKMVTAMNRKLNYYLRVLHDPAKAKASILKVSKQKNIPAHVKEQMKDWITSLEQPPIWPNFNALTAQDHEMEKFLKQFNKDSDEGPLFSSQIYTEVTDYQLMAILTEYLNAHPQTRFAADILYWLGILEGRVGENLFYSLGDVYFYTCADQYPTQPIAKDCYDQYLEDLHLWYMKNGKAVFPVEVEKKLQALKLKLKL